VIDMPVYEVIPMASVKIVAQPAHAADRLRWRLMGTVMPMMRFYHD